MAALTAQAGASGACTSETLGVQGTPITIAYCVTGKAKATAGQEILVPYNATFSGPRGTVGKTGDLHFLAEDGVSRVIYNLELSNLGMQGTLHLTLAYVGGTVRVEGALLTPGAITIK